MRRTATSGRRGASATEFALTLPVLMLITSAIVDYGWYLGQSTNVMNAAREGLRVGVQVPFDGGPDAEAEQWAETLLQGYGIGCGATVTCTITGTVTTVESYDALMLSVAVPFSPLVGMVPIPETLHVELTMALEDQQ